MVSDNAGLIGIKVKDNFVRATVQVEDNNRDTMVAIGEQYNSELKKIFNENPDVEYKILLDTRKTKVEGLKIPERLTELTDEITNMDNVERAAVLGRQVLRDEIVALMFSRVAEHKANYFTDEEKALAWLGIESN